MRCSWSASSPRSAHHQRADASLEARPGRTMGEAWSRAAGPTSSCSIPSQNDCLIRTLFQACAAAAQARTAVGVGAWAHESGSRAHARAQMGHGGHAGLPTARSLATRTAAGFHPLRNADDDRVRAAGKPHHVARGAAARQWRHRAWAVGTHRPPFDPASRPRMGAQRPAAAAADRDGPRRRGGAAPRTNTGATLATTQWHGHDRWPQRWAVGRRMVGRVPQVAGGRRIGRSNACLTTITVS